MRCFCVHVKGRRKISLVLSLLIGFILIAGTALAVPVPILAISAGGIKGTIASIIISLLLQTGVAPTNTQWLNQLNSAYGVSSSIGTIEDCIANGLLTETASGLVDSGLSNAIASAPEYTTLGLEELFGTTASDVGVTVASGASNICNTAINVGTLGTIGAFAGAASIGVGLGVLINHVREKFVDFIRQGVPITYNEDAINNTQVGFKPIINAYGGSSTTQYRVVYNYVPLRSIVCGYLNEGQTQYSLVGALMDNTVASCRYSVYLSPSNRFERSGAFGMNHTPQVIGYQSGVGNWGNPQVNVLTFENYQECVDYINQNLNNPDYKYYPYSPDLIGPYGNQVANVDPNTGDIIAPGIKPMVPDGKDMFPVDMDDYQDYVIDANQNTEDGVTGEDTQGEGFIDFIDQYLQDVNEPDTPIIPENPIDIPTYPDRPVNPNQPTIPDKPEIPAEDIETNLDAATTPDLRGIFPFCIPWDIYNLVLIFDTGENRQAPHITFTFPGTNWIIDVDLSEFNTVAGLLRLLELILFIVGLMVATRSLIGAGG